MLVWVGLTEPYNHTPDYIAPDHPFQFGMNGRSGTRARPSPRVVEERVHVTGHAFTVALREWTDCVWVYPHRQRYVTCQRATVGEFQSTI